MNLENTSEIRKCALRRLADAGQANRIAAIFAGLALGLSALVTLVGFLLDLRMSQATGLSGMGIRTTLSSVQSLMPIVAALATLCIEVGYQAAMLRVARGQYVSPQTLRLGFERFWLLMRCLILQGLILCVITFGGIYLSTILFMLTPFSNRAVALLAPVMEKVTVLNPGMVLDEALYSQLMQALLPAFGICAVVVALLAVPVLYRFRMVHFVIIDKPGMGAMAVFRESRKMMKGNCRKLLRLDVSLWWYYAANVLAGLLCYGDILLPKLGLQLPWSGTVSYYVFFVLYLGAQFAVYYFLRNRVETAYAIVYDAIRPKQTQTGGAVLGSIFQQ